MANFWQRAKYVSLYGGGLINWLFIAPQFKVDYPHSCCIFPPLAPRIRYPWESFMKHTKDLETTKAEKDNPVTRGALNEQT